MWSELLKIKKKSLHQGKVKNKKGVCTGDAYFFELKKNCKKVVRMESLERNFMYVQA